MTDCNSMQLMLDDGLRHQAKRQSEAERQSEMTVLFILRLTNENFELA